MTISSRKAGDVIILDLKGKLTLGDAPGFRETIRKVLEAGQRRIVLDLNGLTTVDTTGVGELVGAYTTVVNRGGTLKLMNAPLKVRDIFQITQLSTVFDWYEDELEAVASF